MNRLARLRAQLQEHGVATTLAKLVRYPLKPLFVGGALRELHASAAAASDSSDLYARVQSFEHRGIVISSWQFESEILGLLGLLRSIQPRRILEIGTASGGTLFMLARAAADDALILSIDLPGGAFGGESGYPKWRARLYRGFGRGPQRMEILRADSHDPATLARVSDLLAGLPLDVLFIDGDHSLAGVTRDYEMYAPLVREGGVIAFHDIVEHGPNGDPGQVPEFWRSVKARHEMTTELVEDWNWGSCGIGVIHVG